MQKAISAETKRLPRAPFGADDWGMTPSINAAILELAQAGALRSVSLMANLPYLQSGLAELVAIPGLELALHVNLTLGPSLASPPAEFSGLGALLKELAGGHWDAARITREVAAQHGAVVRAGGRVDMFDGHQHVHLLPPVFRAVAAFARAEGRPRLRAVTAAAHPAFFLTQVCRRLPAARGIRWEPYSVRRVPREGLRALVHPAHPAHLAHPEKTKGIRHQDGSPALREEDYRYVMDWVNKNLSTAGDKERPAPSDRWGLPGD
jgi:predicted glycoside hydrolase/deacetylase ChbG (UPF0249 family)